MTVSGFKANFNKDKFITITLTSGVIYRQNVIIDTIVVDDTNELFKYTSIDGYEYVADIGDVAVIKSVP